MIFFRQKKKKEMDDIRLIKLYKEFLEQTIVDKSFLFEIITQIDMFYSNGIVKCENSNLYAKNIGTSPDYLEIRSDYDNLFCSFTEWNGKRIISIHQTKLKNGNVKIVKEERKEYNCNNDKNESERTTIEKIFDQSGKLIYDSELKTNDDYDSLPSSLIYDSVSYFSNNFSLLKTWHIANGSLIRYKLTKNYYRESSEISEMYLLCEKPYEGEQANIYNFYDLDEDLFKSFFTGEITIEELISLNRAYNNQLVKK